eukprot:CAMPEP_0174386096 /NCGR_PEP_ID=MMETSP0811_2-20130205/127044_1 /TAXON_ID=73025 ORGANISM="Eutreptiella gymnastica-like, Strain CCMP1594" /NCGR_SAMPLE_ID=MMETSP0811_2 /ASSEMBLY_ACC=CAM_ASM_000667 /LENGTH=40 /DNA_ID= /DNA_START= /DNA_END= /DNA_ORIENTATION=
MCTADEWLNNSRNNNFEQQQQVTQATSHWTPVVHYPAPMT